jgi:predicted PurR-regulated permease PerM
VGPAPTGSSRTGSAGPILQLTVSPLLADNARRWAWFGLVAALAIWVAYLVREIWLPLGIALLIAMVLDPVVDRLERRGWSRAKGTSAIFFAFFVIAAAVLYFAIPAVVTQAQAISAQASPYFPGPGNEAKAQGKLSAMLAKTKTPPYVREAMVRGMGSLANSLRRSTAWLSEHAMEVMSDLIWIVIIPIVTFYSLKDFHLILGKGLLLVPRARRDFVSSMVSEVTAIFAKFLRGLMIVSALNGLATWVLLTVLRTPNAFTLGAIAGVLYSVPYLGALLTIVMVAGVAFLHGGLQYMVLVVALNVLLHQIIFDQVITPRILGGHVGLHPILSIVALLAGNVLLGILGMVLAVPVAASIQVVVLTLVPKLRHDVAVSADASAPVDSTESLSKETQDQQLATDATEELHRSVSQAVDNIEQQAKLAREQDAA